MELKTYDALIIFPAQGSGELDSKNMFEELVKKHNGKILTRTELGKRTLGYRIRKASEGYCVAFTFDLLPSQVNLLKQSLGLAEGILSHTITIKTPTGRLKSIGTRSAQAGERRW